MTAVATFANAYASIIAANAIGAYFLIAKYCKECRAKRVQS